MPCSESKDTYPIVIFYPGNEFSERGYLCGEVVVDELLKTKNYFIHEVQENLSNVADDVVGVIGSVTLSKKRKKKGDWVKLRIHEKMPLVVDLVSDSAVMDCKECQLIVYDKLCFMRSELLLSESCEVPSEDTTEDHFKRLLKSLKHRQFLSRKPSEFNPTVKFILVNVIRGLKCLDRFIDKFLFILKFSTLALHMSGFVRNAVWGLELSLQRKGFTTLKSGNYILGLVGDWLGGVLLIYWFMSLVQMQDVMEALASHSEVVVVTLKDMVRYLMGSPADLKLNSPLNNVLGKFFLFHIDLWWAFLGYSRPLLELGFKTFVCLGSLGLSFQIAILADLLAVASFHVYIIYVYAARLYHAQVMGLASLSRVFLGRKRNPLPGRVDSCPYSTEQLLIGTIAFTVLLFLLPTTLVYYVVFTAIRLVLIAVGGLLTQARFVLSALPLYSTLLWLYDSPATTSSVRLTPRWVTTEQFVLCVTPVQSSWWRTVKACMPSHMAPPPAVQWGRLCWHLLSGRLVYPV
uniref:Phosphatidylinositol N-acetylglucosaminyltransferase subunit Q n=1 Tax=Graphocephala atropunctata TaxID=36148 RepID=A0A1B6MFZ7_9HEMI